MCVTVVVIWVVERGMRGRGRGRRRRENGGRWLRWEEGGEFGYDFCVSRLKFQNSAKI